MLNNLTKLIDAAYLAAGSPKLVKKIATPAALGHTTADPAQVEVLVKRMAEKQPHLWAGNIERVENDLGTFGYKNRTPADMALCGYIGREAAHIGVSDDCLPATIWEVYARSVLFANDDNPADRQRKITEHAIPKIVAEIATNREVATAQVAQMEADPAIGNEIPDHEPGDNLAGKQFAKAMCGKLMFVAALKKWFRWDSQRWAVCERYEEMVAAKFVAGKILDYATAKFKADSTSPTAKKLLAFATSLQNLKRMLAMIEMAKSEDGMTIGNPTELDSNPWLLGVRNGVVNLRDGSLLQADPKMLLTRQSAAEYHDDAQCQKWLEFLNQIFNGDQDTIDYIQRALGYTLTGITTEEVLFICFGHGANGKSVFANVVNTIMADYAQAAPPSLLVARKNDDGGARGDIARMCGARLASINELQGGDRLDEQVVKMLAGREQISARYNYGEFFDFWPTAKPWLRTNHKPIIVGEDDGIWRRLHLIPFTRKFAEHERDPHLESKLLEERDGILAWMVRGCLEWQRLGLKPSATVRRESATYRKESDLLGQFLDEMSTAKPESRTEQPFLFEQYRKWHDANGTRAGSKTTFTKKMAERGYGTARSNGKRYYTGLEVVTSALL